MIKSYEDYIDQMCELFPEIKKEDIYNIVKYGTAKLCSYITNGFDYAIDYKWPASSIFIGKRNKIGDTQFKIVQESRKEFWLNNAKRRTEEKKK